METAMQIPEFSNFDEYVLGMEGRPWYLHPALHIGLMCCCLFYVSFLICLWTAPGKSFYGEKGKKI